MDDLAALRDALLGLEEAFGRARRDRLALIRAVAAVPVAPEDTEHRRALAAALLRRERADADAVAGPAAQLRASMAEVAAAEAAARGLTGYPEVAQRLAEIEATWRAALERSDGFAVRLGQNASKEIAHAFAAYVAALHALHALSAGASPAVIDATAERFAGALAALEAQIGAGGGPPTVPGA
jgi:hypothetical protein